MKYLSKISNLKLFLTLLLVTSIIALTACAPDQQGKDDKEKEQVEKKETIVFADPGWDSVRFHNDVAKLIIENGYGYPTDATMGSTPATFTGLRNGDIDILMETWTQNIEKVYNEAIDAGDIIEVSTNFDDNAQGFYVPTYVIKGDPERGIDPMAPDLKTVKDLAKYPEVFKDVEDPSKGRIYGAIPGWKVDEIMREKVKTYELDKLYNYFSPGSDTALASSIAAAYEKGEPWVGYYWEPTWVIGKYDMTLLEDEPYSKKKWENGYACEFPSVDVTVTVHKDMTEKAPEIVEFLKSYKTSSALTSEALAYMQNNEGATTEDAAKWFLQNHEEIWTKWVSKDIAEKVKAAIK
ncbi:MAG: glycine betaine/proline transport system substrate-binding protein [Candidatus Petromonas sp.]|jgi:glycine betaine/proline transport system substrate-binding protein|nr:glycine betaine/proline transport system substrate-binding protein [Candidatus Petromonas sp.]